MIEGANRLNQVKTYYFAKKLREIAQLNNEGHQIINLGIGSPDLTPPKVANQTLIQSLKTEKAHQYQSYYGLPELRTAFADYYKKYFEVDLDMSNEVLPLIGSKEGIMHIAMSFLNPGDKVLIPNPGYPAYKMTTLLAGGQPLLYNLTEESSWLPDFSELEKLDLASVKLMWINYPHMPTGTKAPKQILQKIIKFGTKHNILICHDNPYAMILNDEPLSILSIDGAKQTAIELCSLSKGHNMAGWRLGAVVGHQNHINTIMKFKSNMDSGMFKPIQLAAVAALQSDKQWFSQLNATYQTRRESGWKIFDSLELEYKKDSAGLFLWGKVHSHDGNYWSDKLLKAAKVFLTPGFIFGTNGEQYLRLSLCNPVSVINEAHQRIMNTL